MTPKRMSKADQTMQTSPPLTRRDFIRTSASLAVVPGILGSAQLGHGAPKPAPWSVACRDVHLKTMGQPDSWSALKELGAIGVEVAVTEDLQCPNLVHPRKKYSVASADGIIGLKEDLEIHDLRITALCMNNRLDERLEQELATAKQLVAVAQKLDVRAIRIDVVPRAIKPEEFMSFAVKACRQLCELAESTPVRYGVENHGHWTNRPEILEGLLDGVGSAHLGLTLDAMNFYWFGHPLRDLYSILEKFAARTFHTHCKNLRYPEDKRNTARPIGWEYEQHAAPLYDGDIDYQRVADILTQAKYGGDLCLENECLGRFPEAQRAGILKKEVALLRKLAAE
jgi:sugar phosphate isomerase/epimerase